MIQTPDQPLDLKASDYALLTDLYQLSMIACYCGEGLENQPASFELFVRRLPSDFGYLIAVGLEQALEYLETWHFSDQQLEALEKTGIFAQVPQKFWSLLQGGKFGGDVWAVPEGTAIFANEPILRVEAPLWQAQLVETYLLNTLNYQTLVATKAARMRDIAGPEAILLEFGARRAFSPQGSLWAARAALAGGLDATSNVLAALNLGQKPSGTMAHSLIMAFEATQGSEDDAFRAFHRYFPAASLLIDTYDTVAAATRIAQQVQKGELEITGVRLDSGDLVELSQKVRSLLPDVKIFASGDLDEWEIQRLKQQGASIDGYGLGTKLVSGAAVNGVYKLVEINGIPTMKQSSHKATYPGRKQIFRAQDDHQIYYDRLGLAHETPNPNEQPLLQLMMQQGKRINKRETLATIQKRTRRSVESLAPQIRQLDHPLSLTLEVSEALENLRSTVKERLQSELING
ncbi:nicotinate phosphoribosyltransferase [Gloeothece verrucosa]|uniref:Nicotinate phosphoribosyltransferase n=1 Tax=Gloeothece verrucosa (strain PCC 7822) TaxID=497965 RepID=E0U8H8_GLOV7|nr:nicotinate phosphoribosyltransferase [Gloeothece verrucosa]ADN13724.1 nicotinate phosphoribosyltransferase [Gloeothece verrucosa PCC 7822]